MESCALHVDGSGCVTATISTTSSGQGHETLVSTVVGEVLHMPPETIRIARATSQTGHATNSPVGSRMAIMLGGAAANAAMELRDKCMAAAAAEWGLPQDTLEWRDGGVSAAGGKQLDWNALVHLFHRNAHRLAPGQQPGLSAIHTLQVPTGGALPDAEGRIQMYPCYAFETHWVLVRMDRVLCRPEIVGYWMGHDCGVEINPDIVRGMSLGGIAHGIGAAFLEEFRVNAEGQPQSVTLLDYAMPSVHEVPRVEIIKQVTPSPLTVFGQKGSGESGYLGAPAAIASAINDALQPLGARIDHLPMRMPEISDIAAAAEGRP
jgi:2-furoyl-CoA dehydrogenase large subunit